MNEEKPIGLPDGVLKKTNGMQAGLIYAPYICVEVPEGTAKRDPVYDNYMKEYRKNHNACPSCGSTGSYSTTLMGYILNMDKKDEYKNLNRCTCVSCGNVHTAHDRVKKEEK